LHLKGRTLPFQETRQSELDVRLDAVDVPHWLAAAHPFLPAEWRPQASSGKLDVALTVGFAMRPPPAVPLLTLKGRMQLDQLALSLRDAPMLGDATLGWQSLKVEGIDTAPLARQVALGKVDVDGLTWRSQLGVAAPASAKASNAKADPQAASSASAATAESKKTPDAWAWRVGEIDLRAGRIDVQPVMPAPQT